MDKSHSDSNASECQGQRETASQGTVAALKSRQCAKIKEIRAALISVGCVSIDEQAAVLGLGRSTTWAALKGNHKASGLSVTILNRMLASPRLPDAVRNKILEYVDEKAAGSYGHSHKQRRQFVSRLMLNREGTFGFETRQSTVSASQDADITRHKVDAKA